MKRVAIVINTRFGQTEKIALHLRQGFMALGLETQIFSLRNAKDFLAVDVRDFDAVVIGAPVYQQHFSKDMIRWTKNNLALLKLKTTGFFSVSGNAGDAHKQARAADDMLLKTFLDQSGLQPQFVASFGGCIHFTKYNFFLKFIMRKISEKAQGSVDTSRDLELTDWAQVTAFGNAFVEGDLTSRFATGVRFVQPQPPAPKLIATKAAG